MRLITWCNQIRAIAWFKCIWYCTFVICRRVCIKDLNLRGIESEFMPNCALFPLPKEFYVILDQALIF